VKDLILIELIKCLSDLASFLRLKVAERNICIDIDFIRTYSFCGDYYPLRGMWYKINNKKCKIRLDLSVPI
jgi:hypothetical protein